jgi:uncharacterized protein
VKIWGLLPTVQFSTKDNTIAIHLHFSSTYTSKIDGEEATVIVDSSYPFGDSVKVSIKCAKPVTIALRIPHWTRGQYDSSDSKASLKDGYLYFEHTADTAGATSTLQLKLAMQAYPVFPHPSTGKDSIAFQRGPFIYCAESNDNTELASLDTTFVSPEANITDSMVDDLAGASKVPVLDVKCSVKKSWEEGTGSLYHAAKPEWETGKNLRLIPYFLRENRGGDGAMRVWFGRA